MPTLKPSCSSKRHLMLAQKNSTSPADCTSRLEHGKSCPPSGGRRDRNETGERLCPAPRQTRHSLRFAEQDHVCGGGQQGREERVKNADRLKLVKNADRLKGLLVKNADRLKLTTDRRSQNRQSNRVGRTEKAGPVGGRDNLSPPANMEEESEQTIITEAILLDGHTTFWLPSIPPPARNFVRRSRNRKNTTLASTSRCAWTAKANHTANYNNGIHNNIGIHYCANE